MVLMTLFGLEALLGAQTLARFIMVAPSYTALVWLMMALRGLVTLGQGMVVMLLGRRAPPTPPPGDAHHTLRVGPSTGWPEGRRDFVPTFTTAYADNTTRSLPPGDTLRPTSLVGPAFAWGHS